MSCLILFDSRPANYSIEDDVKMGKLESPDHLNARMTPWRDAHKLNQFNVHYRFSIGR